MLEKIKSLYVLKIIINKIQNKKYLKLFAYNNYLQQKLNISIDTYINYFYKIEVEIEMLNNRNKLSKDDKKNEFIQIIDEKDRQFYHIFINEEKEEIKRNYILKNEIGTKIKVLIDLNVKSISQLFCNCHYRF